MGTLNLAVPLMIIDRSLLPGSESAFIPVCMSSFYLSSYHFRINECALNVCRNENEFIHLTRQVVSGKFRKTHIWNQSTYRPTNQPIIHLSSVDEISGMIITYLAVVPLDMYHSKTLQQIRLQLHV